jgi:opacity protein-like surface antigen
MYFKMTRSPYIIAALTLLLCVTSFTSYAKDLQPTKAYLSHSAEHPFQGLYGGVGVGGMFNQTNTKTSTTLPFPSSAFFANSQNNMEAASSAVFANLFAGYLYPIKNIYLGPEIYLTIGNPSFSNSQSTRASLPTETLTTSTNGHLNTYELGIDLRLGISATPSSLIYGLLGCAFNSFSLNSTSTISRPLIPLSTTVNTGTSQSVLGLRLGAGVEQKLTNNYLLRVSYIFERFPSVNTSNSTTASPADPFFQLGPITNSTTSRVINNEVMAAIVYQFDEIL